VSARHYICAYTIKHSFRKHGKTHHEYVCGYLEQPLPDFDPASDFAVCGWIKRGTPGSNAVAISIGCAELDCSLLGIGEWNSDGNLQAFRGLAEGYHNPSAILFLQNKVNARVQVGVWQHVSLVQTGDDWAYFVNGRLVASKAAARVPHGAVTNVRALVANCRPYLTRLPVGQALSGTQSLGARLGGSVGRRDRGCEGVDTGSDHE
jgi:hypothetical protein